MAASQRVRSKQLNRAFLIDLRHKLKRAEEELWSLGLPRNAWRILLRHLDFDVGVYSVAVHLPRSGVLASRMSEPEREPLRALAAFRWATVAALSHSAMSCKSARHAFALGYSLRENLALLEQGFLVKRASRRNLVKGGRNRAGKHGPFRQFVQELVKVYPKASAKELIDLIEREDGVRGAISRTGDPTFSIDEVFIDDGLIRYFTRGKSKIVRFSSFANTVTVAKKSRR